MLACWVIDRLGLNAKHMLRVHGIAMDVWLLCIPVALLTGWIYSLAFISAASIYANFASHFSGYEAARAEVNSPDA